MTDADYLNKAIQVGNELPEPYNFGAVVVRDGQIIASEHGHVHEQNNPSLHAEVSAITAACKKLGTHEIDGAVLYSSHEPCAMCFSCASWAHVDRIVYAKPADEINEGMYEFEGLSLAELAKHMHRPIRIDYIRTTP